MTNKCVKELVDLLMCLKFPPCVLASGCHLKGVIGALEATQAMSVLWACTDYDPSSVATYDPLKMTTICRNMLG
jgi:hypothetical protein